MYETIDCIVHTAVLSECMAAPPSPCLGGPNDFSGTDWSSFDWDNADRDALWAWMDEAELSELFAMTFHLPAGFSESLDYILCESFFEDPLAFIRELALQEDNIIEHWGIMIPLDMCYGVYGNTGYTDFPGVVASISLTPEDSDAARYILRAFQDGVEEHWGIEIPRTGDMLEVIAFLFVLGAGGIIMTVSWKKEF